MTSPLEKVTDTKKYEIQLVNIVGESVSFVPTGLSSGETAIVEFEKYYKPEGISDEDYKILVRTMRAIFDGKRKATVNPDTGEDSDTFVTEPLPPCSEKEKYLVLESLLYRKRVLLQQLYSQGILTPAEMKKKINEMRSSKRDESVEGKETLFVRTLLIHLLRLEKFIKFYVETQSCINVEDIVHEALELDLNDERIKELLKQFVFFLLQSSHPLKDYTKVHPTAPAFVARLEKNLLKDKFPAFLQTYKNNKFPIPDTLAKVLEATDLDPKILKQQAEDAIQFERLKIIKYIRDIVPPNDPFWKRVGDPNDPLKLLDALLERNDSLLNEIQRLESEKSDIDNKLKTCEQGQKALQAEKANLEARIQQLEATLQTRTNQSAQLQQLQDEKVAMEADFNRRLSDLSKQVSDCQAEKQALEQRVADLTRINQTLTTEIGPLRQSAQRLIQLQADVARDIDDLRRRHQAALAAEQTRTAEKEDARVAAVAVAQQLQTDLIAKQDELVRAQTALQAVQTSIADKDRAIADLQRSLTDCEASVDTLRAEIQAKTDEIKRLNGEIQKGKDRITELEDELTTVRQTIQQASDDNGLLKDEIQQARDMIQTLENDLLAEKALVEEKEIALKACEAEKAALKSSASGSSQEVGKLTSELTTVKEERDAAVTKVSVLEATLKSLQAQIADAQEEAKAQRALVAQRDSTITDLQTNLKTKDDALGEKETEIQTQKDRADIAEGSVAQLEDEKRRLVLDSEKRLEDTRVQLEKIFEDGLQKARTDYEEQLRRALDQGKQLSDEEKAAIQAELDKALELVEQTKRDAAKARADYEKSLGEGHQTALQEEKRRSEGEKALLEAEVLKAKQETESTRTEYQQAFEDAIQKTREEYEEKLQTALQEEKRRCDEETRAALEGKKLAEEGKAVAEEALATAEAGLATSEEEKEKILKAVQDMAAWIESEGDADSIEIGDDTPASSELRQILEKLSEEAPSTPSATASAERTKTTTYICYLVFLTAFLWQTNFPHLPEEQPTDAIGKEKYTRQKVIQTLFPALFNGGKTPQAETWAEKTSSLSSTYLFKSGLYKDIETRSSSRIHREEFDGKLQVESTIVHRYLNIFNKIARAMETPSKDGLVLGLTHVDVAYIDLLIAKLQSLVTDYRSVYSRLDLDSRFASLVGNIMIVNQPLINGALLDRYLVKDARGFHIVTKTGAEEPSQINYAVLFFCFLVVMRDNLNHIQSTAKNAQCPLPPFLVKHVPHSPKK